MAWTSASTSLAERSCSSPRRMAPHCTSPRSIHSGKMSPLPSIPKRQEEDGVRGSWDTDVLYCSLLIRGTRPDAELPTRPALCSQEAQFAQHSSSPRISINSVPRKTGMFSELGQLTECSPGPGDYNVAASWQSAVGWKRKTCVKFESRPARNSTWMLSPRHMRLCRSGMIIHDLDVSFAELPGPGAYFSDRPRSAELRFGGATREGPGYLQATASSRRKRRCRSGHLQNREASELQRRRRRCCKDHLAPKTRLVRMIQKRAVRWLVWLWATWCAYDKSAVC